MAIDDFESFYQQCFKLIFWFCYKRIGILEDTEDVVSEVFQAIYSKKNLNYSDSKYLKNLVFKIAKNKASDYLRRKYKLNLIFVPVQEDLEEVYQEEEKRRESINLAKIHLNKIKRELNKEEKKLYELRFRDLLDISEIANILGQTPNNIKVRTYRLIKKLKKLWEKTK